MIQGRRIASTALVFSTCVRADPSDVEVNSTYLSNVAPIKPDAITLLDNSRSLYLAQRYADMNREYNLKQDYGILTVEDQNSHNAAMASFSQDVFSEVQSYQENTQKDKTLAWLKNDPDTAAIAQDGKVPAMVVGGAWAVYHGTTYHLATHGVTISPGVSVKNKSASLGMSSPIVNASVSANQQTVITNVDRGLVYHISIDYTNTTYNQSVAPANNTVSLNYRIPL